MKREAKKSAVVEEQLGRKGGYPKPASYTYISSNYNARLRPVVNEDIGIDTSRLREDRESALRREKEKSKEENRLTKDYDEYKHDKRPYQLELYPKDNVATNPRLYNMTYQMKPPVEAAATRVPQYAMAWGWNSEGRSGNGYLQEVVYPRQVQNSSHKSYITAAAGKHHSLLIDDQGIVYSFGDGRHGQLGYGNEFIPVPVKGGKLQVFPRQVNPSGSIKEGRDLKMVQVGGGDHFSVCKEVAPSEGIYLYRNLKRMEAAMLEIKSIYYDSDAVQGAWAKIRHEKFKVSQAASGAVLVWGTGDKGQLGLGKILTFAPNPTIIPRFRNIPITQIAVGIDHVLAVTSMGVLYSWGSGRNGKLGHGDYENRFFPSIVRYLDPFIVEYVAAGDNHSACLTTSKRGLPRDVQLKQVSCWGRGAHGRLGNGTNTNRNVPVLVEPRGLPSIDGGQFIQVACGGAHTIALGYTKIEKTFSNPYGIRTFILTWGYGKNGQLGTGYAIDTFVPVKVRWPKWEFATEISAGRSWSMCRTVTGEGYSWGMGLRGQLGQVDDPRYSLVPKRIINFAAFTFLQSKASHTVSLAVPKKYMTEEISLESVKRTDNPFEPLVVRRLQEVHCDIIYSFDCCKRHTNPSYMTNKRRYICRTCSISSVCLTCYRICHQGHDVYEKLYVEESGSSRNSPYLQREKDNEEEATKESWIKYYDRLEDNRIKEEIRLDKRAQEFHSKYASWVRQNRREIEMAKSAKMSKKGGAKNSAKNNVTKSLSVNLKMGGDAHAKRVKGIQKKMKGIRDAGTAKIKIPMLLAVRNFNIILEKRKKEKENNNNNNLSAPDKSKRETIINSAPSEKRKTVISDSKKQSASQSASPTENTRSSSRDSMFFSRNTSSNQERIDKYLKMYDKFQFESNTVYNEPNKIPKQQEYCHCGLHNKHCKLSAVIAEETIDYELGITQLDKLEIDLSDHRNQMALRIQRRGRRQIGKQRRRQIIREHRELLREFAEKIWVDTIMTFIWQKYDRSLAEFRRKYEIFAMEIEDDNKHKFDYKYNLQACFGGIKALEYGVKKLFSRASQVVPRVRRRSITDDMNYTLAFTWASVRDLQLRLHPHSRLPTDELAKLTKYIPRYDPREGQFYDSDITLFTRIHTRDKVNDSIKRMFYKQEADDEARLQREEDSRRLEFIKVRQQKKDKMAVAAALRAGLPPPPPTRIELPVTVIRDNGIIWENDDEEPGLDIYKKDSRPKMDRRHSIGDPSELCSRLKVMRETIAIASYAKRRNSLPAARLDPLHPTERPPLPYVQQSVKSLDLYASRFQLLQEATAVEFKRLWDSMKSSKRRNICRKLNGNSWLNPRLPLSMRDMLSNNERRRTIAEPERLAKQLHLMFETRNGFSKLKKYQNKTFGMKRVRRSFDLGEEMDLISGDINGKLGYTFVDGWKVSNRNDFHKESMLMQTRMAFSGFAKKDLDESDLLAQWTMESSHEAASSGAPSTPAVGVHSDDDDGDAARKKRGGGMARLPKVKPAAKSAAKKAIPTKKIAQQQQQQQRPVIWQEYFSAEGYTYYYRPDTGESVWEAPSGSAEHLQICQQYQDDESGFWYWFNTVTGETDWC